MAPCLQVKVPVVNSAGGSFCWNYASDTFYSSYAGANICCNFAVFWGSTAIVLVELSATFMLVDLFVAIVQVTVSVTIMQLQVSAEFMQVKVFTANIWVTIFIETTQVGDSVGIMQLVFSTVHYAHGYFFCSYADDCFICTLMKKLTDV